MTTNRNHVSLSPLVNHIAEEIRQHKRGECYPLIVVTKRIIHLSEFVKLGNDLSDLLTDWGIHRTKLATSFFELIDLFLAEGIDLILGIEQVPSSILSQIDRLLSRPCYLHRQLVIISQTNPEAFLPADPSIQAQFKREFLVTEWPKRTR